MVSEVKNYELAYLLSPSVSEEEALTHAGKISTIITDAKGVVKYVDTPKKRQLAYLVNKQTTAYFCLTRFTMASGLVKEVKKKIAEDKNILRHSIVIEEKASMVFRPMRPMRPSAPKMRPQPTTPVPPAEKLDLEALDKKLEEILGR